MSRFDALIANLPPQHPHRRFESESADHLRDECGVFGVFGHPEAAKLIYLGLYALQHRGQEGAGIVCARDGVLTAHRGVGLVNDVFKPHKLARVSGTQGIGHVRYSTFGSSNLRNVQPLVVDYARGSMALCHNGNLVNADVVREQLEEEGAIFQATTDTATIIHLVARSKAPTFTDTVIDALKQVIGAFTVLAMNGKEIVAARDPLGFRPLWLGKLDGGYVWAPDSRRTVSCEKRGLIWTDILTGKPSEPVPVPRHVNIVDLSADGKWLIFEIRNYLGAQYTIDFMPADGGGEVFRQALLLAQRIYLTTVHTTAHCDTFFPPLVPGEWTTIEEQPVPADEKNEFPSTFRILERSGETQPQHTGGAR